MTRRPIGILGGTFDPIHAGHLAAAVAARQALGLAEILLVPSHHPPHRPAQPRTSAYHRFAMVALAAQDDEGLLASDVELVADGPSYTSRTLARLHARGLAASQIFFITGADAFAEIATWANYPAILDLAHFAVVSRPGHPAPALSEEMPALAGRMRVAGTAGAGDLATIIHLVDARTPDVSSTGIRVPRSRGWYRFRSRATSRVTGCTGNTDQGLGTRD
jgi:nicotinate-nucleotide adenylyltransferase